MNDILCQQILQNVGSTEYMGELGMIEIFCQDDNA